MKKFTYINLIDLRMIKNLIMVLNSQNPYMALDKLVELYLKKLALFYSKTIFHKDKLTQIFLERQTIKIY